MKKGALVVQVKRFPKNAAQYLEWLGIVGILAMLLFTTIDVIGANLFNNPLRGGTELVRFSQIIAISSAIAINFYLGRHISIDFIVSKLPKLIQNIIGKIITAFCLIFFIILTWQSIRYGASLYRAGEISSSANVPLYPFAFVIALSAAVAALFFVEELFGKTDTRKFFNGIVQKKGGAKSGTS